MAESSNGNDATAVRTGPSRRHASRTEESLLRCALTGALLPPAELLPFEVLRPGLVERIRRDHPQFGPEALISRREVNGYRIKHVEELLSEERGELTDLDRQVAASLAEGDLLSKNVERDYEQQRTIGQRISDRLADFAGSWAFLLAFFLAILGWMGVNVGLLVRDAFDPYPFILLNLILSCVAAVQAPIIMMSQKRQEAKDRLRSLNDYRVNLKAELEIRNLHEKVDHLISKQWQRLAEIQQLQIEIMQDSK